jgi:cell fate regulator YaaT (PSP1 superfamily)
MQLVYEVWLDAGMRTDCVADEQLHLRKNDTVIISYYQHEDYGRVLQCRGELPAGVDETSFPLIVRRASLQDQSHANDNNRFTKMTLHKVEGIVDKHELGISLVDIHISFDRKKMVLRFTSPQRVDFRALVRELAMKLKIKVELRQIGVRDVAQMNGGLGTCGRVLCCSSWMHEFKSVNIRMAKEQGLAHHNNIILGQCGRLKCCLEFEHEGYKMMASQMPLHGSRCFVDGQEGSIVDRRLLQNTVLVRIKQDGKIVNVPRSELELYEANGSTCEDDCGPSACETSSGSCSTGCGS